jgi:outer membrane protein assembly factor BamE (lipoprotein component of BamABCDE complex)
MNYAEVSRVLGEPDTIEGGYLPYWDYIEETGCGRIELTNDELHSWREL